MYEGLYRIHVISFILLQLLHKMVYAMQFVGNVYGLRAMRIALAASDAVTGLPQTGDTSVIANQESASCATVILALAVLRYISFIDTFIVMEQYGRDVNAIRAGHAILAIVAGDGRVLGYQISRVEEKLLLVFCQRN